MMNNSKEPYIIYYIISNAEFVVVSCVHQKGVADYSLMQLTKPNVSVCFRVLVDKDRSMSVLER